MNKDIINTIIYRLEAEGIDADYADENDQIEWKDDFGDTHYIQSDTIVTDKHKTAWFQTSYSSGKALLRLFEGNLNLNWVPRSNHLDWGISCQLLQFLGEDLLFVYTEKHGSYMCIVSNNELKESGRIYIDQLALLDGHLYSLIPEYARNGNEAVKVISMPALVSLPSISNEAALKMGVDFKPLSDIVFEQ